MWGMSNSEEDIRLRRLMYQALTFEANTEWDDEVCMQSL